MMNSQFRSRAGRVLATALVLVGARRLSAQANLSSQGYGFPTGQLSSHAYGTGGAIAELDPLSPVNPASVALFGTRIVSFQIEPEYRTVKVGGTSETTNIARYPNVFGAVPVGSQFAVSLGASTLLDRTSTSIFKTTQTLSVGDTVPMTTTYRIDGAMSDVRLAGGWAPNTWLRLGLGVHAITGHNRVGITEAFSDTTTFSPLSQQIVLGFSGSALSAGVQLVGKNVSAGFSMRQGGSLHVSAEDTLLATGRVPNRFGASLAYTGIANSMIAVRTSHDNWSSLGSLGSPGLKGVDSWDSSVGADISGPRVGANPVFLRVGFRNRTLPFQAENRDVTENSITGGLGTTFANNRVLTDIALIHASRSASGLDASEHAWTVSIGIAVRP